MNFNDISKLLESKSIFDLWCINCLTSNLMQDDTRNKIIKRQLRVGMEITYFESSENRLIEASILEIRKNKVVIRNKHDNKTWLLNFYMINLDNVTNILDNLRAVGISKANLKVNDHVGWMSQKINKELFGNVVKLNPKKATIKLSNGELWTVPYNMLFSVMDADPSYNQDKFLVIDSEATVIN